MGNVGDTRASDFSFELMRSTEQFHAVKNNRTGDNSTTLPGVSHRSEPDSRFPRPGLPDQTENFASIQGEIDAVDDRHPFLISESFYIQLFNIQ